MVATHRRNKVAPQSSPEVLGIINGCVGAIDFQNLISIVNPGESEFPVAELIMISKKIAQK